MSEPTVQPDNPEHTSPAMTANQDTQPVGDKSQTKLPGHVKASQEHKSGLQGVGFTQLILLILVVVFVWQWLDGNRMISDMQRQLAEKIAEMSASNKASQILMTQSQEQVRELSVKVTMMEERFAEAQNQRAALEALYNDLSVNRDETALAEVEQLLMVADQQLRLTANVKAALIAMQSGDARLQRMDRGPFNGLRKTIGKDMDKLRALPSVDIPGLSLQLNELISEVDNLPLVYQRRVDTHNEITATDPIEEAAWKNFLRELWSEFRSLIRIENTGKSEIPLLPPDQEFFLRENLKLRLLAARLALISRDESSFRQELKSIKYWTSRYFDGKSKQVVQMQAELKKLSESEIKIDLPDIGASLQAVRNYRQAQERSAEHSHFSKGAR